MDGQKIGQFTGEFVDGIRTKDLTGEFVDGHNSAKSLVALYDISSSSLTIDERTMAAAAVLLPTSDDYPAIDNTLPAQTGGANIYIIRCGCGVEEDEVCVRGCHD